MRLGDAVVLLFFSVGIVIVLLTSPSPDYSTGYRSTSSYSSSSTSNDSSGWRTPRMSLDETGTTLLWIIGVMGILLLLSLKQVRSALFGAAGGVIGHPKVLFWFVVGFVGAVMVMMGINPDPSTYVFPPILIALGIGVLAAGLGSVS